MARLMSVLVLLIGLAFVAAALLAARALTKAERECERNGGVLLRTGAGVECVKVERGPLL